jgi:hypothetical protein
VCLFCVWQPVDLSQFTPKSAQETYHILLEELVHHAREQQQKHISKRKRYRTKIDIVRTTTQSPNSPTLLATSSLFDDDDHDSDDSGGDESGIVLHNDDGNVCDDGGQEFDDNKTLRDSVDQPQGELDVARWRTSMDSHGYTDGYTSDVTTSTPSSLLVNNNNSNNNNNNNSNSNNNNNNTNNNTNNNNNNNNNNNTNTNNNTTPTNRRKRTIDHVHSAQSTPTTSTATSPVLVQTPPSLNSSAPDIAADHSQASTPLSHQAKRRRTSTTDTNDSPASNLTSAQEKDLQYLREKLRLKEQYAKRKAQLVQENMQLQAKLFCKVAKVFANVLQEHRSTAPTTTMTSTTSPPSSVAAGAVDEPQAPQ